MVVSHRISRQLAHEGGKDISNMPQPTLPPSRSCPWYSFLLETELTPGPQCCWRIKSMKNPNHPIRNRTHDLKTCWYICIPTAMMMATTCNHRNTGNLGNKGNCGNWSNQSSYTCIGLHEKCLLSLYGFNKTWIFLTDFSINASMWHFTKIHPAGAKFFPCWSIDRQTDRHDKAKSLFT